MTPKEFIQSKGITKLYHFTDRDNLDFIIKNGGLYSWKDCEEKGINIPRPGGSQSSRGLDSHYNLEHYVRTSFVREHPMMYVAMTDGRISNPVILEISLDVADLPQTQFADRNAAKNGVQFGYGLDYAKKIHFNAVKVRKHFDLGDDEQQFFQAEVMVKNFIPLKYITNISNFGIPIPSKPNTFQTRVPYTAPITRNNPAAMIFLVDQSASMGNMTEYKGERMMLAEAAARAVNEQIEEIVSRCVKGDEIRHYFDIAVIGYGTTAYSGWAGPLAGRDFVSPQELSDNPYKKIIEKHKKRTRSGETIVEIERNQWINVRHDGRQTYLHEALKKAKSLAEEWMSSHDANCYPPTIINVTDGEYFGISDEDMTQLANDVKTLQTNDGNVIFMNIHITPDATVDDMIELPTDIGEVKNNEYSTRLFKLSSLMPLAYNPMIATIKNISADDQTRYVGMAVNLDANKLIQLLNVGTPTTVTHNK